MSIPMPYPFLFVVPSNVFLGSTKDILIREHRDPDIVLYHRVVLKVVRDGSSFHGFLHDMGNIKFSKEHQPTGHSGGQGRFIEQVLDRIYSGYKFDGKGDHVVP